MVKISPQKSLELELRSLTQNGSEPYIQKLQGGAQTSPQERRVYGAGFFKRQQFKNNMIDTSESQSTNDS